MAANNFQVGGDHYAKNAIQPWDYIVGNPLCTEVKRSRNIEEFKRGL